MGVWRDTNGHGGIQNDTEMNAEEHRRVVHREMWNGTEDCRVT